MVIYADILFIVNLYIDFFLIISAVKFLHLKVSTVRSIFGAALGAICSFSAILPIQNNFISILLNIAAAFLISLAVTAPSKLWVYIKFSCAYFIFSFLFAGVMLMLTNIFPLKNTVVRNNIVYFDISPIFLFVSTAVAYIIIHLSRKYLMPSASNVRYKKIIIENGGKKAEVFAKADTGNALREPFSGLPVLIAEHDTLSPILPKSLIDGEPEASDKIRLIPFNTISGDGILRGFKADKVYFSGSEDTIDCYIAVYDKKLSAGSFDGIYNPDILIEDAKATIG